MSAEFYSVIKNLNLDSLGNPNLTVHQAIDAAKTNISFFLRITSSLHEESPAYEKLREKLSQSLEAIKSTVPLDDYSLCYGRDEKDPWKRSLYIQELDKWIYDLSSQIPRHPYISEYIVFRRRYWEDYVSSL